MSGSGKRITAGAIDIPQRRADVGRAVSGDIVIGESSGSISISTQIKGGCNFVTNPRSAD
jgi:hypothetical protein